MWLVGYETSVGVVGHSISCSCGYCILLAVLGVLRNCSWLTSGCGFSSY